MNINIEKNMKLPVIEIFTSIQGEGRYAGHPSIFIRVVGCNLACVFKNSICDTSYASFKPETPIYNTVDEVYDAFVAESKKHPLIEHVVITGGEPMLYKEALCELLLKIKGTEYNSDRFSSYFVTIETNGTLSPKIISDDKKYDYWPYLVDFYSISPKLSSSVDSKGVIPDNMSKKHDKTRINIQNLVEYTQHMVQLKFVYSGPECVSEIKNLRDEIIKSMGMSEKIPEGVYRDILPIMLMPEGQTEEQLENNRKECVVQCVENGWIYTDRLHIIIWGDKRCV